MQICSSQTWRTTKTPRKADKSMLKAPNRRSATARLDNRVYECFFSYFLCVTINYDDCNVQDYCRMGSNGCDGDQNPTDR